MLARLTIILPDNEWDALQRMAEADCRVPKEQMRFLLREAAGKRELLTIRQEHQEEEDGKASATRR